MQADRVEVSWDNEKSKWQVRIEVGDEVVRRHCDLPRDADEQTLRAAAQKTVGAVDQLAVQSARVRVAGFLREAR